MPELPEVETTKNGISPHILNQSITGFIVREPRLRWIVDTQALEQLTNKKIIAIERRAKYLLIRTKTYSLMIHLGMSGKLRIVPAKTPVEKHDHIDMLLPNNQCMRYNDPRRFGSWLISPDPYQHPRLINLGPEPLSRAFNQKYLKLACAKSKKPIKVLIMDQVCVVGVGNIYAQESLFTAGIHPKTPANHVPEKKLAVLLKAIKAILKSAIQSGGTTLKDFEKPDSKPGYFQIKLKVYGKTGLPCPQCKSPLQTETLAQRTTCFCLKCQPLEGKRESVAEV